MAGLWGGLAFMGLGSARSNARLDGAIAAVREAVATVTLIPFTEVGADEDLAEDLLLDALEFEGLALILEEVFSLPDPVPAGLWRVPLNRTPATLAEWCLAQSSVSAWKVARASAKPNPLLRRPGRRA